MLCRTVAIAFVVVLLFEESACWECARRKLMPYEHWPSNDAGGACVGGSSGVDFHHHQKEGVVRSLTVWYTSHADSNSGVKAIRLEYFNDLKTHIFGHSEHGQTHQTIRFQPGETLVGDLTLSGNGFGTRLGFIEFSTSAGQHFAAGQNSHKKYLFPSGNSFISGVAGRAGADIDSLAFIFWKPLTGLKYVAISYPTLDSLAKMRSPEVVASFDYCNDNDVPRQFVSSTLSKEETIGSDSCFTASFSETIGSSLTVEASVPTLADVTAQTHWELSAQQEFQNCKNHSTTKTMGFTSPALTLGAHKRTQFRYTQWQGSLRSLPFTARLRMTFTDGSTYETTESGSYKGTAFLTIQQSWTKEKAGVTRCPRAAFKNHTVLLV
eukprot:TRINITY_DN5145_c0_g1_i1.p1 TRINITY_DN5145_c0_g1~~TRINITY_DN5145_c0_g1_i1.p1  ORF type:complete len:380 (-),score=34.23 TRINITY_DN5145_c0_g1_i1:22-1161(-)